MKEYKIPQDLLNEYLSTLKCLEEFRCLETVEIYKQLDLRRQSLHNRILDSIGLKRGDEEFKFYFAQLLDELTNK